jgi:hypothetical protein
LTELIARQEIERRKRGNVRHKCGSVASRPCTDRRSYLSCVLSRERAICWERGGAFFFVPRKLLARSRKGNPRRNRGTIVTCPSEGLTVRESGRETPGAAPFRRIGARVELVAGQ